MPENKGLLKSIATELNVHPIHLRMFMANFRCKLNNIKADFEKNNIVNPKPFVEWVGGKSRIPCK